MTMFAADRGGRRSVVDLGINSPYRPHVVVDGGDGERLGVQFRMEPGIRLTPEVATKCSVLLLYPLVDYSPLLPGSRFTIVEGPRAVGEGDVITVVQQPPDTR
ncbi:hypothetical protein EXU48_23960 [Occultella glacieicola]|uniref:Uncharacterized protein n=1 Tax=Occultella glacieicola TaxID=2518684 RepID=A0ABY2DWK3_9MICO|nr:hypothetical protein [Occultella glacieicola]TDE88179.1 hypothetical protein EXU48_23960 [Occultella glacieicola]